MTTENTQKQHELEKSREYSRRYYERNKERILRKKKEHYQKTEVKRRAQLKRKLPDAVKALRSIRETQAMQGNCPTCGRRLTVMSKPKEMLLGGKYVVEMYSTGHLRHILCLEESSLSYWLQNVLPEAQYSHPRTGARLYTYDQVEALAKLKKTYQRKYKNYVSRIRDALHKSWAELAPLGINTERYEKDPNNPKEKFFRVVA